MVAPQDKLIRRDTGHFVHGKALVVSLVPGGKISLKPLGSSRDEEHVLCLLDLWDALVDKAERANAPEATETPAPTVPDNDVLRRLRELAPVVLAREEGSDSREAYLTGVRVSRLIEKVAAELSGAE